MCRSIHATKETASLLASNLGCPLQDDNVVGGTEGRIERAGGDDSVGDSDVGLGGAGEDSIVGVGRVINAGEDSVVGLGGGVGAGEDSVVGVGGVVSAGEDSVVGLRGGVGDGEDSVVGVGGVVSAGKDSVVGLGSGVGDGEDSVVGLGGVDSVVGAGRMGLEGVGGVIRGMDGGDERRADGVGPDTEELLQQLSEAEKVLTWKGQGDEGGKAQGGEDRREDGKELGGGKGAGADGTPLPLRVTRSKNLGTMITRRRNQKKN